MHRDVGQSPHESRFYIISVRHILLVLLCITFMLLKMPPPATDGKVDAKDIAPNWKVLQMELIYTSFVHRF